MDVTVRGSSVCGCPGLRGLMARSISTADGRQLVAQIVYFDFRSFRLQAFADFGIDLPLSISVSSHKRQAEFFFGRMAAGRALLSAGSAPTQIAIGAFREPIWPPMLVGSISHNAGIAAAVVVAGKRWGGVGIDVETIVSNDTDLDAIISIAMDTEEKRAMSIASDRISVRMMATLIFSAKECIFKGAFHDVRDFFGFEAARFVAIDTEHQILTFVLTADLSAQFRDGRRCDVAYSTLADNALLTNFVC